MRTWVSLILLLLVLVVSADTPLVADRHFDQAQLEIYREDAAFDYSTSYDKSGSWFTLLLIYFLEKMSHIFNIQGLGDMLPFIFRTLAILVLLAVLYYVFRSQFGSILEREGKKVNMPLPIMTSVDEQEDYDQLLADSLKDQNYKLAIRYLFLKTLHQMHRHGEVKITQWKAPFDYVKEVSGEKKNDLASLVDLFESTWYGDHEAEELTYNKGANFAKTLMG